MTVGELKKKLEEFPEDAKIIHSIYDSLSDSYVYCDLSDLVMIEKNNEVHLS